MLEFLEVFRIVVDRCRIRCKHDGRSGTLNVHAVCACRRLLPTLAETHLEGIPTPHIAPTSGSLVTNYNAHLEIDILVHSPRLLPMLI